MISHRYHSVFVHVPKTAGTSIEFALGHFRKMRWGVQDHRSIREIEPLSLHDMLGMAGQGAGRKILLKRARAMLAGRPSVSRLHYQTYFKFTFVRNPWARIYSWYRNVLREPRHRRAYGVPSDCAFPVFVHRHLDPTRGPMRSQLHWLLDKDNRIPLDFVGRFEHLDRDFEFVREKLRLPDGELPKLVMGGDALNYVERYDPPMIDRIARLYAAEIEQFGFRFGE